MNADLTVEILLARVETLSTRVERLEQARAGRATESEEFLSMKELCVRFHKSRWVLGPQVKAAVAAGKVRMHRATPTSHPTYRVRDVELLNDHG